MWVEPGALDCTLHWIDGRIDVAKLLHQILPSLAVDFHLLLYQGCFNELNLAPNLGKLVDNLFQQLADVVKCLSWHLKTEHGHSIEKVPEFTIIFTILKCSEIVGIARTLQEDFYNMGTWFLPTLSTKQSGHQFVSIMKSRTRRNGWVWRNWIRGSHPERLLKWTRLLIGFILSLVQWFVMVL